MKKSPINTRTIAVQKNGKSATGTFYAPCFAFLEQNQFT
ncbi:hypothetical protein PPIS_a4011 [Pseudoalteromonas piscicida]|uniref:Uncharacterized protein n=1 Tax=Pseudoalteromonas piscicida TaxID=43662 RepID=A0ABN5CKI8_PSEO7|nr:hypothetical protein PPIS_a4011 [Pseudoalteromonas piscicida]